ncbi:hypothetical protein [Flavobacterium wongokense]|uniref:hypothetical protein n=1 Tax=Flavobacterium wongokense TaxID=2910674 RepID=UPI001F2B022A|nr:hypothetical protein [Flavobacterium sp. WG47]MCF6131617.1 hypothetical protein [Flavobacterium sp. WG47]
MRKVLMLALLALGTTAMVNAQTAPAAKAEVKKEVKHAKKAAKKAEKAAVKADAAATNAKK